MEVIFQLLFDLVVALLGPAKAFSLLGGGLVGIVAWALVNKRRHDLGGRVPANAEGQPLLDAQGLVEVAAAVEDPVVALEYIGDDARGARRVAVFPTTGQRLQRPQFCWIAKHEADECLTRLRAAGIRTATADTETSGRWHCVGTDDGGPVLVWMSPRRRPAVLEVSGCWVVRFGGRTRVIDKSAIVAVEAWASETWNRHEVRLHVTTAAGTEVITVARKRVPVAFHDFYDGIDFLWDSAWALGVGRELAERLGLELRRTGEF